MVSPQESKDDKNIKGKLFLPDCEWFRTNFEMDLSDVQLSKEDTASMLIYLLTIPNVSHFVFVFYCLFGRAQGGWEVRT